MGHHWYCGCVATTGLLLALAPVRAEAADWLFCKGVATFADAMNRAVALSLDLDQRTVHMARCRRYAELKGFCHGRVLYADDHRFRFGGIESRENTRLGIALYGDDAAINAGYDPVRLKVVFLGRCVPASGPSGVRRN
jgi:hypothetical protein